MERPEFLQKHIRPRQKNLQDDLIITDGGASVWTKSIHNIKQISHGCLACKQGTWLCVFVGHKCNLNCRYCPQGTQEDKNIQIDDPDAAQSVWLDDIIRIIEISPRGTFTGVSYSGGEPFMYLHKILKLANNISKFDELIYQWVYTNGLLVTEDKIKSLVDQNIKEIRFHLGATNFSKHVLQKLEIAKKYFKHVNVESPSTPELKQRLIKDNIIYTLFNIGVTQINLPELYLTDQQFLDSYLNYECYTYSSLARGRHISPIFSRVITYDIIEFVTQNNIDIIINDCSHEARDIQIIKKLKNPFYQL